MSPTLLCACLATLYESIIISKFKKYRTLKKINETIHVKCFVYQSIQAIFLGLFFKSISIAC